MRPEVKKSSVVKEFLTKERCHILEIANDTGDKQISIARARVEPGVTTAWHLLKGISERYIIVSGLGRVELNKLEPVNVSAGDVVRIPADTPQRITNTGHVDLVFFCVCSPRFYEDCYESLE
jgi:mannose-6-phosphate isomerase-like protein (cupin superfamily)